MQKRDLFLDKNSVRILKSNDAALVETLGLIKSSFAFMAGRIDPPSSVESLSLQKLNRMAQLGWVVVIGKPVMACVVATPRPQSLYLGKISVAPSERGRGDARALVEACEPLAVKLGVNYLELQVRIELLENQRAFARMGFVKISDDCHSGYDRVTEITMQKPFN